MSYGERSDEDLLTATVRDPEAFGAFYRRHGVAVFRYMLFRTGSVNEAAELSGEVFAAASSRPDASSVWALRRAPGCLGSPTISLPTAAGEGGLRPPLAPAWESTASRYRHHVTAV